MNYIEFVAKCKELRTAMKDNKEISKAEVKEVADFYTSGLMPVEDIEKYARFMGLLKEYIS